MGYYYDFGVIAVGPIEKKEKFLQELKFEGQKEILDEGDWLVNYFQKNFKEKIDEITVWEREENEYGQVYVKDKNTKKEKVVMFYLKDSIKNINEGTFSFLKELCNRLDFGYGMCAVGEEWGDKIQDDNFDYSKQTAKYVDHVVYALLYPVQYVELDL